MRHIRLALAALLAALSVPLVTCAQQPTPPAPPPTALPGLTYDAPFFPGASHDPAIPTPDSILGFPVGQRPARHAQIEACLKAWAAASPRTSLVEYARSHEGRALYYLVISSEANIKRLGQIKEEIGRLADPRSVSDADGQRLADSLPAVAWLAHTIHGDETSGSDAALALAYHLCAGRDADVRDLLDQLIVIIDPLMNPDGRDRYLTMLAQDRTAQPSVDDQSALHSRPWPAGRTNHYLFDMNRDWLFGVHPESRGRLAAIGSWHPQLLVDAHEMSPQETFLFSPPREPVNPNIAPTTKTWWELFSKGQAAAMDRFGWRYYTGEWNEELYPGYSTTWAAFRGAITILYEQASISTDAVRRPEGTLQTYREAVHHQLVGSLANLETLRTNRQAVLRDYLAQRRQAVADDVPYARRTFAVVPGPNRSRDEGFVDLLRLQGIEVCSAPEPFVAAAGTDRLGRPVENLQFPAGTMLIPNRQPEARMAAAMLELDTRPSPAFLLEERRELLRMGRSRLYDITGWNLMMLHDVDGYELSMPLPQGAPRFEALPAAPAAPERPAGAPVPVAFAIDGADDRSVAAAARLMERGAHVRVTDKATELDGRRYARGTVLVTRADNQLFVGDLAATVTQAATELGVPAVPIGSGLGPGDLPDLGGEHIVLLQQPRIAVLSRPPFSISGFGEVWHLLDHTLGIRASYIDAAELSTTDLRRYSVLVLPAGGREALKDRFEAIKAWVRSGGTLIAIGSSAAAVATESAGITAARTLPDVLTKLDDYTLAVVREWEGWSGAVDAEAVWSHTPPARLGYPWVPPKAAPKPADEELKRRDAWRRIFMPQGAILAARTDDRSWLTAGCGPVVPVLFDGDTVLMAALSVQAPVRLGAIVPAPAPPEPATPAEKPVQAGKPEEDGEKDKSKEKDVPVPHWAPVPPGYEVRLRMSGLLWPEAADRLSGSAFVTREGVGSGQVILFASSPTFRGAAKGTMRIFANAAIYGPGMGASQPIQP